MKLSENVFIHAGVVRGAKVDLRKKQIDPVQTEGYFILQRREVHLIQTRPVADDHAPFALVLVHQCEEPLPISPGDTGISMPGDMMRNILDSALQAKVNALEVQVI